MVIRDQQLNVSRCSVHAISLWFFSFVLLLSLCSVDLIHDFPFPPFFCQLFPFSDTSVPQGSITKIDE